MKKLGGENANSVNVVAGKISLTWRGKKTTSFGEGNDGKKLRVVAGGPKGDHFVFPRRSSHIEQNRRDVCSRPRFRNSNGVSGEGVVGGRTSKSQVAGRKSNRLRKAGLWTRRGGEGRMTTSR